MAGRFISGSEPPVPFSDVRPETFDPVRLLDPGDPRDARALKQMRQDFMNEVVPEPPARPIYARRR